MKLGKLIQNVDEIKPNGFSNDAKTMWVNEVEGMVQTEVFLLAVEDVIVYDYTADVNTELLVAPPHDKIYWAYLSALIDFANGEYGKYHNTMSLFNSYYGEYMRWYAARYRPADGRAEEDGYYISAYAIAVKHGYEGTEEQWVQSLHGAPGEDGEDGTDGEDGKSAYELAVEAGYEGTEEEFSESLAAAANKLDKPAAAGTDGQVLTSDGEGGQEWRDPTGGTTDHRQLTNRDASDQHPISAITMLQTALDRKMSIPMSGTHDGQFPQYIHGSGITWVQLLGQRVGIVDSGGYFTGNNVEAALQEIGAGKISKPSVAGTSGQVLTSDGEGGQEWRDPTGGGGSNEVWLPAVDASGNISWQKSSSSTAPTARNIRGPQGVQGLPGEDGQDGAPGAPGAPGANGYTPVRGTDYWTAEDIATIKGYVDDAILNGEW